MGTAVAFLVIFFGCYFLFLFCHWLYQKFYTEKRTKTKEAAEFDGIVNDSYVLNDDQEYLTDKRRVQSVLPKNRTKLAEILGFE